MANVCGYLPQTATPTTISNEAAQPQAQHQAPAQPRKKHWWQGFYERRNAGLDNIVTDRPPIGMEACWPGYSNAYGGGAGGGLATLGAMGDVNALNMANGYLQAGGGGGGGGGNDLAVSWVNDVNGFNTLDGYAQVAGGSGPAVSYVSDLDAFNMLDGYVQAGGGSGPAVPYVSEANGFNTANEYGQANGSNGLSLMANGLHEPSQANDEDARLGAHCMNEVRLHIDTLTSYFSHRLLYSFEDDAPARAHALQHWMKTAEQWEGEVPEAWKARLPTLEPSTNAIETILCRQVRIHAMIEWQRREELGLLWAPLAAWQEADINTTALKEQIKLMTTWTQKFDGLLQDLRANFPIPKNALQQFPGPAGWSPFMGADNQASIDGL